MGTVLAFWLLFWTIWMLFGGLPTVGLALIESLAIREPGRQWAWRLVVLVSVWWFTNDFPARRGRRCSGQELRGLPCSAKWASLCW